MGNNTVIITVEEFVRLTSLEGRVKALVSFANHSKYAVERKVIGDILGYKIGDLDGED